MAIKVDHIADVSFADHFLQGEAPVGGKITVMGSTTNGNTFNVRFDDGKVNVRFASGQVNTVYQVGYKDGSTYIFKPEAPGRQGLEGLQLSKGSYKDTQLVAQLNMSAQRTADAVRTTQSSPRTCRPMSTTFRARCSAATFSPTSPSPVGSRSEDVQRATADEVAFSRKSNGNRLTDFI